jgi:hypothetical protein
MLDAHPGVAIPAETLFLNSLAAREGEMSRDELFDAITQAPVWPNVALDARAFRSALDAVEPFTLADGVRAFYRLYAGRFGKSRWGDKTPTYRRSIEAIARLLPEAHFVHVIRDGRDVALSYRGLWFGPGDDLEAQARFWVEHVTAARAQALRVPHATEVRYESLVGDPEATLRSICTFLELPYDAAMLAYHTTSDARLREITQPYGPSPMLPDIERFRSIHERTAHPPDPSRVGRWRTELSADERQTYEGIAGPLLRGLGYEV